MSIEIGSCFVLYGYRFCRSISDRFRYYFEVWENDEQVAWLKYGLYTDLSTAKHFIYFKINNQVLYNPDQLNNTLELPEKFGFVFNNYTAIDLALDSNVNFTSLIKRMIRNKAVTTIINGKAIKDRKQVLQGVNFQYSTSLDRLKHAAITIKQKKALINEINDTLTGEENAGKALASLAKTIPSGNGTTVEKYFTIEKIDNNVAEGEYLTDYETGANVVSYAMGVHPSLIGATPGKNSNSLSGSNIREIFLMKQALSKPMIDRAMRPFQAIKKINGWPSDFVITIPEYTFVTLDQAKSGKNETQNTAA